jgi:two-component system phosphate regulon sensor histidine kinase PhoR
MNVFRSRFFWKIYSTFALLFLSTTLLVSWVAFVKIRAQVTGLTVDNLKAKVEFLAPQAREVLLGTDQEPPDFVKNLGSETGTRITLIDRAGQVVVDSDLKADDLDNHGQRPEVLAAMTQPFGMVERFSKSMQMQLLYVAKAVRDKDGSVLGVLRVSLPADRVNQELTNLQLTMAGIALTGVIMALAIGYSLARRVTVPIREMVVVAEAMRIGRYDRRVRTLGDDELGRLGDTLNRLGAELTSKISELHRLEVVRRDFVANVSHEIKTPLTSVKGYVETLLAGAINDPDNRVRFLEKIERNATRLTNLVQDLLSLAKIEAGEDSLKPVPCEWNPVINSVVARYEDTISGKNLRIKVNAPPQPLVVLGDKEAMTQVLDNLLTNAVKYTPEGGRISVTLSSKGPWAKLEVEDTGIGIPAEHLGRIFERFYRVDKARSRELGGTGLGLSIVKHLVSAMSGDVGVESAVGVGSKFTVKLKMAV